MTEKKTQMKNKTEKRKKLKRRGKRWREKKNHAQKIMSGTETKSSKMTQSLINDNQNRKIRSKSHQLWHSLERDTIIKTKYTTCLKHNIQ